MTENADLTNVPEATHVPKKRTRVPVVWIIPIVAALVGVGIVVQRYLNEGPTIRISFRTAEGIEPGKTFIKYKDVDIGKVTKVVLSKDRFQDRRHGEDGKGARKVCWSTTAGSGS